MSESAFHLLITGCNGQVGHELAALDWAPWQVTPVTRENLDLTDADAIRGLIRDQRPDMVINAAAYTAVDGAESESGLAFRINAAAPGVMAEELSAIGSLLVHYSTDYVFDGEAKRPYRETDATAPSGVYGASKLAGEQAIVASGCDHVILRTSWVYGHRGENFLLTMLRLAGERDELRVVADQFGTPTYAFDLAVMSREVCLRLESGRDPELLGLFHLGNGGETSWHGFAEQIMQRSGNSRVRVHPITTAEFPTAARRPAYSVLDKTRIGRVYGITPPHWCEGLDRCLARLR